MVTIYTNSIESLDTVDSYSSSYSKISIAYVKVVGYMSALIVFSKGVVHVPGRVIV